MKIHRFTILAALLTSTAFAQTNTFPSSGNVGVGTTTPISLLHVVSTYTDADHWLGVFSPGPDTNGYRKELILGYHGGDDYAYIQGHHQNVRWSDLVLQRYGGRLGIGTTTPSATLTLTNGDDARLKLYSNGSSVAVIDAVANTNDSLSRWLSINPSGGAVGIGITNLSHPSSKLLVGGGYVGVDSAYGYTLTDMDTGAYRYVLKRGAPGTLGGTNDLMLTNRAAGGDTIVGSNSGSSGGEVEGIRVKAITGNVGIGTTNPAHKLAVNGTIKAKEVIVETTGWSDYVFADNYALQPLAQVEAHIKEHKHLPGIPSAAEVASEGVNVGDMQAALLAKVEELTLHLIAQEKELARLRETEKAVTALRAEVAQLRQSR